jgi:DNA-binding transcriptional regulator YbjK
MTKTTKAVESSKPAILSAAVSLARKVGLFHFSRIDVANDAEVGESTVSYHFGTMPELRTAVVKYAVEHEILSVLADARSSRESTGVPMSEELRKKVATHIAR